MTETSDIVRRRLSALPLVETGDMTREHRVMLFLENALAGFTPAGAMLARLLARTDLEGRLFAEDMAFDPDGTPLVAETVQDALAEIAGGSFLRIDQNGADIDDVDTFLDNLGFGAAGKLVAAAASTTAIRALLQTEARIRQVRFLGDASARSATSTTSYGTSIGQTQVVTPVSLTSKLVVLALAAGAVTRTSGGLFGSARIDWYNGSVWAAPSGALYTYNVNGQANGGATSTDQRGAVGAMSVLEAADKNAGGDWQFGLRGHVSTGTNTPVFEVTNCRYLALELEGL